MTAVCVPSDPHTAKRQELLAAILSAVQGCQVRFGGRTELATESDERVAVLCGQLEAILSYGLKPRPPNRGLSAIKQVTGIVTSGLSLNLGLPGAENETPVLWWYVRELLTRHEYERFLLLKNVTTDVGRGRAWLRSLLNEHSLERYMHIVVCDEATLTQWYEPWALLRHQETAAMLPNLAAGLDSILFAINIDNGELNGPCQSEGEARAEPGAAVTREPEAVVAPPSTAIPTESTAAAKRRDIKKKKKKIPSQLISFDEDYSRPEGGEARSPLYHSAPTTCLSSPAPSTAHATPFRDRLDKYARLQELEQAKQALDSSRGPGEGVGASRGMGSVGGRPLGEASSPLQDCDVFERTKRHEKDERYTFDDDSLHEPSYQQLFENILPKQTDASPEDSGGNTSENNTGTSQVPVTRPQRPNSIYNQETGSYKSNLSNLSGDSFPSSDGDAGTVFTPVGRNSACSLIPVSPRGFTPFTGSRSDDENSIHSYTQEEVEEAAAAAVAAVLDGRGGSRGGGVISPPSVSSTLPSSSSGDTTLTLDDLKSAVLEISRARDAAEGRRAEVAAALTQEMEASSMLRAEIALLHTHQQDATDKLTARLNALARENELLKHQLKKYVGAVQLLRRQETQEGGGGQLSRTTPDYRDYHHEATAYEKKLIQLKKYVGAVQLLRRQETQEGGGGQLSRTTPDYRDYHHEATAYEKKLIQVAEMHGELMEFNERLHKLLRLRESQVRTLRQQLVELRGPLPDTPEEEEEALGSPRSPAQEVEASGGPRTLINIWIPTAFLTGSSADAHHVYQIYIRIKDDEWNIYRRFAQFYELHRQLKKKDPILKSFDFPQKKTFGYKDEGVVEERRVRLQHYLRQLVNLLLTSHPQLTASPDKATFTTVLPFFAEMQLTQDAGSSSSGSGGRHRSTRRSVLSRLSGAGPVMDQAGVPQYNGL
ncbi:Sorting nexin-29 [Chionoecetes opilio]|uniref:Sorting nexin-29 n=1 Tax=Chionoecetes opilio TaxID=41210 RepID=A0A8J4YI51_CHIOP|nr:Sorting nexin-29 [Chionoecetes opilio]